MSNAFGCLPGLLSCFPPSHLQHNPTGSTFFALFRLCIFGVFLLAPSSLGAAGDAHIVHSGTSAYNGTIYVVDEGELRHLRFGSPTGDDQTSVLRADLTSTPMEYIRYLGLAAVYRPDARHGLMIGLGGGAFPNLARRLQPGMSLEVVEIDPEVTKVARRYFGVKPDKKLIVTVADGAAFVSTAKNARYDLIVIDAYSGVGIPAALQTDAFFDEVKRILSPTGCAVANIAAEDDRQERSLLLALRRVAPYMDCFRAIMWDNLIVMTCQTSPLPGDLLKRQASRVARARKLDFDLAVPASRLDRSCVQALARSDP